MAVANAAILEALAEVLGSRMKHTSPSGTPSLPYMTGPDGLWSTPGVERDIISTAVAPVGIAGRLPSRASAYMNPLFAYLTSFDEAVGTGPDGVCDDPPTAGPMRNCHQTAQFGRYSYMTRELEINRVGQLINRSEPTDLRFLNGNWLDKNMGSIVQPGVPGAAALARESMVRMVELGIAFQRKLVRQVYQGNPANNSAGGGYREFPGLDILIGTDKVDAITGTQCSALDSDIKNFGYKNVSNMAGDADVVNVLTYMFRYLKHTAERTGMNPVKWAIVMRAGAFWEITNVWPCSYMTYKCGFRATDGTQVVNVSASDQIAMRDAMRQGNYLLIDGDQVEVIIDDCITEETNTQTGSVPSGSFASDIYIVPLTVRGGLSVTYWEYFDYRNGPLQAAIDAGYANEFWTDDGRYLWHRKPPVNWCIQWLAKLEPRLVMLTPHLAGRLLNVVYSPLQHERDSYPDQPYYVGGGIGSRSTAPSFYSDWNLS